jgi:hypothetical protein
MRRRSSPVGRLSTPPSDRVGNLPPLLGIFPDYAAPIVRNGTDGRELLMARWGMPTPAKYLVGGRSTRA